MMHNTIYFTWAIWLVWQHADTLVWLLPSFTSERVQTIFFLTKPQGPSEKFGVCGWDYIACSCTHERPIYKAASSAVPKQRSVAIWYPLWTEVVVLKPLIDCVRIHNQLDHWLCLTIHGFCCFLSITTFPFAVPFKVHFRLRKVKIALTGNYVHEYDYMVKPVCMWQSFGNNLQ